MIQIRRIPGNSPGIGYKVQLRIFRRKLHFMFMLWSQRFDEFGDAYVE
jgi:hypothetical protein